MKGVRFYRLWNNSFVDYKNELVAFVHTSKIWHCPTFSIALYYDLDDKCHGKGMLSQSMINEDSRSNLSRRITEDEVKELAPDFYKRVMEFPRTEYTVWKRSWDDGMVYHRYK